MNNESIKPVVNPAKLEKWFLLRDQLKELREAENKLRMEIFNSAFPEPIEGTNKLELSDGYILKATYPITRKIDVAVLDSIKEQLVNNHIKVDKLVKWEPELMIRGYRTLDEEELALFDQCLIIKEGSPQMEIVLPASAKKNGKG
jgi:hypothetical protein